MGAVAFEVAALASIKFARQPFVGPRPSRSVGASRRPTPWRAGWSAVRRSALATRLAVLVAVAGVFAPILYYMLGTAAAASFGSEAEIAAFLGRYRGVVQLVVLVAVFVVPSVLSRVGVAPALLFAPLAAVAAAVAISVSAELAVVVIAQASTRVFDSAVQTPAEKLVQNLLPRQLRGRVHGFLDGVAKRAGAIVGGLAASALVVWMPVLAGVTVAVAVVWLAVAWQVRRRFADLAVAELAVRGSSGADDGDTVGSLVDGRSIDRLRADLGSTERRELAVGLIERLGERGRVDAALELVTAAARVNRGDRAALLAALARLPPSADSAAGPALLDLLDDASTDAMHTVLAVRVAGALALAQPDAEWSGRASARFDRLRGDDSLPVAFSARVALARIAGERREVDELIDRQLEGEVRGAALAELRAQVRSLIDAAETGGSRSRLLRRARRLLSGARASAPDAADAFAVAGEVVTRCAGTGPTGAEMVLFRSEAREIARRTVEAGRVGSAEATPASPAVRAAALRLLAVISDPEDANTMARALGDADEEVGDAAADGLRRLGEHALEVLLVAASFGRRPARNARSRCCATPESPALRSTT